MGLGAVTSFKRDRYPIAEATGVSMSTREERFYEQASREVAENQLSQGIWGKAFSLGLGDEQKAKALYMRLRAEQLERDYQDTIGNMLQERWPYIQALQRFVCPYCEAQTTARFTAWSGRYYCRSCGIELRVSGPPIKVRSTEPVAIGEKRNNPMAVTGFVLGLVSVVLYEVGILPILAVVFSGIGLASFKPEAQKNKWMAGWGLALGVVYTIMMLNHYGHLK